MKKYQNFGFYKTINKKSNHEELTKRFLKIQSLRFSFIFHEISFKKSFYIFFIFNFMKSFSKESTAARSTIIGKLFSKLLLFTLIFSIFIPGGMVNALSPAYTLTANLNNSGLSFNLTGTVNANPYVGQFTQHHVFVNWGDGTIHPIAMTENFTDDPVNKILTGTWADSHTYSTSGTFTILSVPE